jgi:hypothetical protein
MAKNFYFAWVDPGTAFNPAVHNVENEDVFSHEFSHDEGGFASLSLVIRNPRIGLLNAGRKLWAYYSFNKGTDAVPDIVPIFYGRVTGLPDDLFDTLVTLTFTARPDDFVTQKMALAATLKVLPYWDPIFVTPDSWEDPDTVLEARSAFWHIDPVTHVVTISDVLNAEDGVVDLPASDMLYESMRLTLQSVPLRSITMQATIPWTQSAQNTLDLKPAIIKVFGGEPLVTSFTMQGLISSWPKSGSKLGSGWQVVSGNLQDVSSTAVKPLPIPEIFNQGELPVMAEGSIFFPLKVTGRYWGGVDGAGFDFNYEIVGAAKGYAVPTLSVQYTAGREFAQIVNFTLYTDQQPIVTAAAEDETLVISLTANKVSDITRGGSTPMVDVRKRDYVHSPRGLQSIEHLILIARAHLVGRSRTVKLAFQTDFETSLQYSLRKAGTVHDDRLPGGVATGKVTSIKHTLDGDSGSPISEITIACAIGYGGSYTTVPGTPTYVDEGYVDREYQEYATDIALTGTSDIQWYVPPFAAFDDDIDFVRGLTTENAILQLSVTNSAASQAAAITAAGSGADQTALSTILQEIPTQVTLQLAPMEGGPYTQVVTVQVSDLIIPKQIDLEAASV